jgi:PPOX class probable F420-dependent enzyme
MPGQAPAARIRAFLAGSRRGVLATADAAGGPRLVPICYALDEGSDGEATLILYSALDEKPKREGDPRRLARVRDLTARPAASVLVDRWSEDWGRLAWVRLACRGRVLEPDGPDTLQHQRAVAALRTKYPQYGTHRLEHRPLIRFACTVAASWGDLAGAPMEATEGAPEPDVEAM